MSSAAGDLSVTGRTRVVESDAAADLDGDGRWSRTYLANSSLTISGGTSEIQRSVIGERLLGLPRDRMPA